MSRQARKLSSKDMQRNITKTAPSPMCLNAVEIIEQIVTEDGHYNAWYISRKTKNYDIQAVVSGTLSKSCGNIAEDAENLGYKIDRDSLKKNSTNENISEIFVTDDDVTSGRILVKTKDNFLWEMECDVLALDSENIDRAIEELKEAASTIDLKEEYNLNDRYIRNNLANSYLNVEEIHIPEGYMMYAFVGEVSAVNIFKIHGTSEKGANLWIAWSNDITDGYERTKEGSFRGKPITWYIYSDGTAIANMYMRGCTIKNASEEEINTFIDIVSSMKKE